MSLTVAGPFIATTAAQAAVIVLWVLAVVGAWIGYWTWACWFVAYEKDRNATAWAIAGAVIGPFAFLPLAVVPDLTEYDAETSVRD